MAVPKIWQEASINGTIQKLAGIMDTPPMGLLGVSLCNNEEHRTSTSAIFLEYILYKYIFHILRFSPL